jgi:ArsR family transcriptional regulator, virulence genes transcriptional regulator
MDALNRAQNNTKLPRGGAANLGKRGTRARSDLEALANQAAAAARMLKLLGNERRLLVLCLLAARGEMRVGELTEAVGLSQSALSQHLARMRADGLVTVRRQAQAMHYRIVDVRAARVLKLLKNIYCGDLR